MKKILSYWRLLEICGILSAIIVRQADTDFEDFDALKRIVGDHYNIDTLWKSILCLKIASLMWPRRYGPRFALIWILQIVSMIFFRKRIWHSVNCCIDGEVNRRSQDGWLEVTDSRLLPSRRFRRFLMNRLWKWSINQMSSMSLSPLIRTSFLPNFLMGTIRIGKPILCNLVFKLIYYGG